MVLIEKMDRLLASTFTLYLKAHQFHWNVEGQDFHQYHTFFGSLYEEIFDSIDTTAEQIRALRSKVKGSLTSFKELSAVRDQMSDLPVQEMVSMLLRDNETVIAILLDVHEEAGKQKQYGLINYIEGRIDSHKKHSWMLRASLTQPGTANESIEPIAEEVDAKTYEITFNK